MMYFSDHEFTMVYDFQMCNIWIYVMIEHVYDGKPLMQDSCFEGV